MTGSRLTACVTTLALCLGTLGGAASAPLTGKGMPAWRAFETTPVVVFGKNGRMTVDDFAAAKQLDAADLRKRHAASGLVVCGRAHGAGQLTLANNVITTAAHVFFDETGRQRASTCRFEIVEGDATVSVGIDMKSINAGSRDPYQLPAVHDWAVARLELPLTGTRPYEIAEKTEQNSDVEFVARGHIDWGGARRLSMEACRLHDQTNRGLEGTREFAMDCETGDGASGGALLEESAGNDLLCAVLVGYRSIRPNAPLPFSAQHYNFVVTVEGAFRDAVVAMARPKVAGADPTAQAGLR
jgi:hypothetical protein